MAENLLLPIPPALRRRPARCPLWLFPIAFPSGSKGSVSAAREKQAGDGDVVLDVEAVVRVVRSYGPPRATAQGRALSFWRGCVW